MKRSTIKTKPYWEMNTAELREATKEFDDPNYHPRARKPTAKQLAQLRRIRRKVARQKQPIVVF
ncbi:MAG TPA: hypothetical protein VGN88_08740, partial [Phycisphaerae bacterium]